MHNEIIQQFLNLYPEECAREIENFSLDDILFFIKHLSKKEIVHLMPCLMPSVAAICLQNLPIELCKEITIELPVSSLKTILPRIQKVLQPELIEILPKSKQVALQHALHFSEKTVGAFMNTHVLFLPQEHTIARALAFIRKFPEEITSSIFCIDNEGQLKGMVTLQDLITEPHTKQISHMMRSCPLILSTHTPISSIATHSIWEKQSTLPVVDKQEVLLGVLEYNKIIVTIQDLLLDNHKESLVESLADIMFMFSHTAENILNEINQLTSDHKGRH